MELDFEIDKLTQSIELVQTGESFITEVLPLEKYDLKQISNENGWNFDWEIDFNNVTREVFKLVKINELQVIQGLISFSVDSGFVQMHLLECAPFNLGNNKLYAGVAGNLVAHACKVSFINGFNGFVGFVAKSKLIEHYEKSLGAIHLGAQRMSIETAAAQKLVKQYFPNFLT